MTTATRSALLLGLIALTGCATNPRPIAEAGQGELILICDLKSGVTEKDVGPAANDLSQLPGVLEVVATGGVGTNVQDPAVNQPSAGTRIAFILSFKDSTSLNNAQSKWNTILKDRGYADKIERVIAYDAVAQNYLVSKEYTEETEAATRARRAAAIKQQNELRSQTK